MTTFNRKMFIVLMLLFSSQVFARNFSICVDFPTEDFGLGRESYLTLIQEEDPMNINNKLDFENIALHDENDKSKSQTMPMVNKIEEENGWYWGEYAPYSNGKFFRLHLKNNIGGFKGHFDVKAEIEDTSGNVEKMTLRCKRTLG